MPAVVKEKSKNTILWMAGNSPAATKPGGKRSETASMSDRLQRNHD